MSQDDAGRSGRSREFRDQHGRTLPERMRQRRLARGLRSNELARALEVSPSYVTMIERGKKVPSEDVAVAIAELLDDDPELYRAWVHSTRFTDPTSTMRGLQQLRYSPNTRRPIPGAAIQPASRRARRLRDLAASETDSLNASADAEAPSLARRIMSRVGFTSPHLAAGPALPPLIALGSVSDDQVTFWRLPWALLDNDPRPRRFAISATSDPNTLLVATPEEFVNIVMTDTGTDLMVSDAWRGWDDQSAPSSGGLAQRLDPRGRLGPLLRDKAGFLATLGASSDVIVLEGAGVSVRRMSIAELEAQLTP